MQRFMHASPFTVVSSPGMHETAAKVLEIVKARHGLELPHQHLSVEQFANGETAVHIPETVRRQHVFFFHPLQSPSPNDATLAMLIANDALMRASAAGITLVAPYMPYLRQDRKDKPRRPISARLLADIIQSNAHVERIITADMHADQEQGFFSIPVDNLTSTSLFADHLTQRLGEKIKDAVVVAPDFGGAVRARRFAGKFGDAPVAIFEKRRPRANHSEVVSLVGEPIEDKIAIIYDDMIDTGGTIRGVARELTRLGAHEAYVCATHGIFSGGAEEKFRAEGVRVLCTDSIPRDENYKMANADWLEIVSMNDLLAEALFEASLVGGSISKLVG